MTSKSHLNLSIVLTSKDSLFAIYDRCRYSLFNIKENFAKKGDFTQ